MFHHLSFVKTVPKILSAVNAKDAASVLILIFILIGAWMHAQQYTGVTIDDAFITFRHALNLVSGNGFTCNPGERVEGTSSPLFALISALPIALKQDPYAFATFIGKLAFCGCCIAAYLTVHHCHPGPWRRTVSLCAAGSVATIPELAYHSQTGMETVLFACVVAVAFLLRIRLKPQNSAWAWAMGIAALIRLEGLVFFALWMIPMAWRALKGNIQWRQVRKDGLSFVAVVAPMFLLRLLYFREWVPNTIVAKSGFGDRYFTTEWPVIWRHLSEDPALENLTTYISAHPWVIFLAALALVWNNTRNAAVHFLLIVVSCTAVVSWAAGDWMPHMRLFVPALPLLFVCAALGIGAVLNQENTGKPHVAFSMMVMGVAMGGLVYGNAGGVERMRLCEVDADKMKALGEKLESIKKEDDWLISDMAGVLPYYWQIPTTDLLGLCSIDVARHGEPQHRGVGRNGVAWLSTRQPAWYVFDDYQGLAMLYLHKNFEPYREKYWVLRFSMEYARTYQTDPPVIVVRKDRPGLEELKNRLDVALVDMRRELHYRGAIRGHQ